MLLRAHPYLLDAELLYCRGRIERRISSGRLDIDFSTEYGWIVVECKCVSLTAEHARQLVRYIDSLTSSGKTVYKAYLVGPSFSEPLPTELLGHPPGIIVEEIPRDIPRFFAFSAGGHYFDGELEICPYDGTRAVPGKELFFDI
ncbi:MAG: hypothetical protein AB1646_12665 [Thermodesulfobacteriota bacterium]